MEKFDKTKLLGFLAVLAFILLFNRNTFLVAGQSDSAEGFFPPPTAYVTSSPSETPTPCNSCFGGLPLGKCICTTDGSQKLCCVWDTIWDPPCALYVEDCAGGGGTCVSSPTPHCEGITSPTPGPTPLNCDQICRDAKGGFWGGYPFILGIPCGPTPSGTPSGTGGGICGSTSAPPNCSDYKVIDGCCCVPCSAFTEGGPPDDGTSAGNLECLCEYGTWDQIKCAANNRVGKCCADVLKSTNVNIPSPPITCHRNHPLGGGKCGSCVDCQAGGSCKEIVIGLCEFGCGDICSVLRHEMGHWYGCWVSKLWTTNECDQIREHIKITHGVCEECKNAKCPTSCFIECGKVNEHCSQYCFKNCPFSNDAKIICGQHGVSCPCPQTGSKTSSDCLVQGCAGYDPVNKFCTLCPGGNNRCACGSGGACVSGFSCTKYANKYGSVCCCKSGGGSSSTTSGP